LYYQLQKEGIGPALFKISSQHMLGGIERNERKNSQNEALLGTNPQASEFETNTPKFNNH